MTVYVTAISPASAGAHEAIQSIRWLDSGNSTSKTMTKQQAVDWLNQRNKLYVVDENGSGT